MNSILQKYNQRAEAIGSLLCIGLDPELKRIPDRFHAGDFPLFEFNKWIIEQTADFMAAVKPNIAFYEARGAQGLTELQLTIEYLRKFHPNIVTICDAKRGDTGNTNESYAAAIFDLLGFDAVTLHPYLGKEALAPFLDRHDKACIVLCRTSNPGAGEFQDLQSDGKPLWQTIADRVGNDWDVDGNCMLVVGATYPDEMRKIRSIVPKTTFLVPGIGAQGGDIDAVVSAGLAADGLGLMISCSRNILFSEDPSSAARNMRDSINASRKAVHAAH